MKSGIMPALAVALVATAGLMGCGKEQCIWTRTYSFPATGWSGDSRLEFAPDSASLARGKASQAIIGVRYGADAPLREFPVVAETESRATGAYTLDTLTIRLLPLEQRTANNARFGVFESVDTIALPDAPKPGWSLTLHPATAEDIKGLISITLELN